jgi:hypothetical protein
MVIIVANDDITSRIFESCLKIWKASAERVEEEFVGMLASNKQPS